MATVTLGAAVNRAYRSIGEPDITAFTAANQLENAMIDAANESVHDIMESHRYRWGLQRDYLTTTAELTTDAVTVTNGSTAVTSVAAVGSAVADDNFTNVAAGQFLRVTGNNDLDSYRISTIDTSSSPDTLVLEDSYQGTTAATGVAYRIIQDTYALTFSGFNELIMLRFGSAQSFLKDEIGIVDIQTIMDRSGGDLHRNASGRPILAAEVGVSSSDQPEIVLWPYPDSAFLIEVWHTINFNNTTFGTNLFGGDAPDIANDAVCHKLKEIAHRFDENGVQGDKWEDAYERARLQLVMRENRTQRDDNQFNLKTYRQRRRGISRGRFGVSQIVFDRE